MKIDNALRKGAALPVGATPRQGRQADTAAGAGSGAASSVRLSSELQLLAGPAAGGEVFDAQKVAQIKAAIAAGHFKVDTHKVADGLVETVQELIRARAG